MSTPIVQKKIDEKFPGAILEKQKIGKSGMLAYWIKEAQLEPIGKMLKEDADLKMDWLEDMEFSQMDQLWIGTYWIRSYQTQSEVTLKISFSKKSLETTSLSGVWGSATSFENEAERNQKITFKKREREYS